MIGIWAFGAVLFEMLTGRRAFEGEDVSLTLSNILQREPDFGALPADTGARVRQTLRVCLQKDPKQRVHAMADVRLALQGAFEPSASPTEALRAPLRTWQRPWGATGIAVIAAIGTGLAVWASTRTELPAPRLARFEISLPASEILDLTTSDQDLAISPDSTRVVYRVRTEARSFLAVRAIDELTARPLLGVNDAFNAGVAPFISPDGAWVGFSDELDGSLKRVSIHGGPAIRICSTGEGLTGIAGASWGEDGSIVFGRARGGGLLRVPAAGGDPEEFTKLAAGETHHAWPEILPGGSVVLFTVRGAGIENAQIAVLDLVTSQRKVLLTGGSYARYASSGHLVYASGGALLAVPFDVERLEVTGTATPIVESVVTKPSGAADFALALDGTLVYVPGEAIDDRTLAWVDRMGREESLSAPARPYTYPRISPDGTRVAIDVRDQEQDIWTWDFAQQTLTRFTFGPEIDTYPIWSPDSQRLIFSSARIGGPAMLFLQAADGTGTPQQLTEGPGLVPLTITPDGTQIVARANGASAGTDLMLVSSPRLSTASGRGERVEPRRAEPLIQTTFAETNAEIAPDGRWLAYESNQSGRDEIYMRPFPDVSGGRWQVSTSGGRMPLWSRNGQELFYMSPDGAIMGVPVKLDPGWRSSTPVRVLQGKYFSGAGRTYDIAPDGRRFLMIKEGSSEDANRVVFVQNWLEGLKRLVPTP